MKIPGNREQNRSNAVKEAHLWLIPLLGIAFLLWYIKNATCDVVYSDYIRLVNSYLPDVCDPKKFFVADVLTRIPINYLARIINVKLFGFSITFDRVLGAVSVGLAAWCFSACIPVSYKVRMHMVYSSYGGRVQPESNGKCLQMEAAGPISLPLPAFSITMNWFLTAITEDRKKSGTRPDLCFFRGLSSWEQPVLTVQSMPLL